MEIHNIPKPSVSFNRIVTYTIWCWVKAIDQKKFDFNIFTDFRGSQREVEMNDLQINVKILSWSKGFKAYSCDGNLQGME